MDGPEILAWLLAGTTVASTGLAWLVWRHGRPAPVARALAVFVALVGVWSLGLVVPGRPGAVLLATAPLGAAAFVHLARRLAGLGHGGGAAAAIGGLTALVAVLSGSGTLIGPMTFRYQGGGLVAVTAALVLAVVGHTILVRAWRTATGKRRRQTGLVLLSLLVGLGSVAGMVPPLLGIVVLPWSLLGLPVYLGLLVFGILRHDVMGVNVWARRAIAWGLVGGLAAVAVAGGLAALPAGLAAARVSFVAVVARSQPRLRSVFGQPTTPSLMSGWTA